MIRDTNRQESLQGEMKHIVAESFTVGKDQVTIAEIKRKQEKLRYVTAFLELFINKPYHLQALDDVSKSFIEELNKRREEPTVYSLKGSGHLDLCTP